MKIGIIGSGNVGSALGRIWGREGHEIMFSSRNPENLKGLAELVGKNACYGLPIEAAKFGDVVALAVPWVQAESAIRSAGPLKDKILIDCTNPLKPGSEGMAVGINTSAGEEIAKMAKGARVVKAFNTTFAALMSSNSRMFGSLKPTGFFCGDDRPAKAKVSGLIEETGLDPLDVGPLMMARYLEPLALLMINLGFNQRMGADIAFRLLRR